MLDCKPQLARFQFRARHAVMAGPMREQLEANNRLRYGALLDRLTAGVKAGTVSLKRAV